MPTTATRALLALLTALALTGCGFSTSEKPPTPEEIADAEAQMRNLPSVQDTEQQLSALLQQITEATETVAPELDWRRKPGGGQSTVNCPGAYNPTDGVSMYTDTFFSATPISDEHWPQALAVVRDLAAAHGITELVVYADAPGNHDVFLYSPEHGNEIRMGAVKASPLSGQTGCRYRAEFLQQQNPK